MKQQSLFETQITFNMAPRLVKEAIAEAVEASGLSRAQAMDKVNELAQAYGVTLIQGSGQGITLDTWEKWLNPADHTRVPSIKALPVICMALGSLSPLKPLVELAGGRLIDQQEAKRLDWANAYLRARDARQEMKKLEGEI